MVILSLLTIKYKSKRKKELKHPLQLLKKTKLAPRAKLLQRVCIVPQLEEKRIVSFQILRGQRIV
jgi:hypothetical protein